MNMRNSILIVSKAMLKRLKNTYNMGTEYSVLRYKTLARTGGFAACKHEKDIIHSKCGKKSKFRS